MKTPTLIYCAAGNARFSQIAENAGYLHGARLPGTTYFPLHFADQDWKKPDREKYMSALSVHRPTMATVLDWEREEQLPEVLSWAEEAAEFVGSVVVVPKVVNGIDRLPQTIGGKPIILGYSVPTRFGATPCVWWEFAGRQVHLLGGSPHRQIQEWDYLRRVADVVSADGNMSNKMAVRHNRFWVPRSLSVGNQWPTLRESNGGEKWGEDAPYEAFRRSCENIVSAWREIEERLSK